MALVINKRPAMHTFARSTSKEKGQESASTVLLVLNPGINELLHEKAEEWAEAKKTADGKRMLEEGTLVEVLEQGAKGEKGVESIPATLEGLDVNMARELAGAVVDATRLEAWLRQEKRASVIEALRAQLKQVREFDKQVADARAAAV